jgi:putative DNA methylase
VYRLLAYSIMPNHVHVVVAASSAVNEASLDQAKSLRGIAPAVPDRMDEQPDVRSPLVDYLRQLKAATKSAAAQLALSGLSLEWHGDSFDYWICSAEELKAIVEYVADNPVSAGLVRSPEQWFFCSAHDRFLHDGQISGWLPEASGAIASE